MLIISMHMIVHAFNEGGGEVVSEYSDLTVSDNHSLS